MRRYLYVEPFDAGSHASFGRWLTEGIDADWTRCTMPGRHWKWRMRGSAAWLAREHGDALSSGHDLLFASSYLPLAELVGLVPGLSDVPRVLYFHENQLAFPVRREHVGGPDYHFGFTQLVSCLAADRVVFNTEHNRDTFLHGARELLRRMPDCVPTGWVETIDERSRILPLPIRYPSREGAGVGAVPPGDPAGPLIVWNHRWEHDKNPEAFFDALGTLVDAGLSFRVAVCGQRFARAPDVFAVAPTLLGDRLEHLGPLERAAYEALLRRADVVVSTARHEFFGVGVLEAMHCGARPLVPDRLAYRETVPAEFRYRSDDALAGALGALLRAWHAGVALRGDFTRHTSRYGAERVLPAYRALFDALVERPVGT